MDRCRQDYGAEAGSFKLVISLFNTIMFPNNFKL